MARGAQGETDDELTMCVLLTDVWLSIVSQFAPIARARASMVSREFRNSITFAYSQGMYTSNMPLYAAIGKGQSGLGHSVVCTPERVFSFGSCHGGRLGHGCDWWEEHDGDEHEDDEHEDDEHVPRTIAELAGKRVVGMAVGGDHTVVSTSERQLYTFGDGACGRLGHGGLENELVPRLVEGLDGKQVTALSAGSYHTVVCTSAGQLYTFGHGAQGQLGHGGVEQEFVPRLVQGLVDMHVTVVAAGGSHTLVCTADGQLYAFGKGGCGQLGHGGQADELMPRLVVGLEGKQMVGLAAGLVHSVVCTAEGQLYTFGYGKHGQLGHGGEKTELMPRHVVGMQGRQIVGLAAGSHHTMLCTTEGHLYTFGKGLRGQLGHGGRKDAHVPRLVQGLVGRKVVGMATGASNHSIVWTTDGQVLAFGHGRNGRLGHGDVKSVYVPRALPEDAFNLNS
jgi:alpha-tubulin suppressor-like RCC1 family protein